MENIDRLRDDLIASDEFKKINKKNPTSIRFQDAWLNKKLLNVKKDINIVIKYVKEHDTVIVLEIENVLDLNIVME